MVPFKFQSRYSSYLLCEDLTSLSRIEPQFLSMCRKKNIDEWNLKILFKPIFHGSNNFILKFHCWRQTRLSILEIKRIQCLSCTQTNFSSLSSKCACTKRYSGCKNSMTPLALCKKTQLYLIQSRVNILFTTIFILNTCISDYVAKM